MKAVSRLGRLASKGIHVINVVLPHMRHLPELKSKGIFSIFPILFTDT